MGSQQSSATGGAREADNCKTCYYVLLDVDEAASSDE
jgi:hypothetical protein